MRLADLVATSARVAETRSRSAKTAALADLLRRLRPEEIDVAAAWLSGHLRQGRIGLGGAAVRNAAPDTAAAEPTLTLGEVDAAFDRIAATTGSGSAAERARLLAGLLARATREEQGFLIRLIFGELRRALMLAGELPAVARAVLTEGRAGLSRFHLQLFRPLQPMLAQTAGDVSEALDRLGRLGDTAFELKLDGARVQVHKAEDGVRVYSRRGNEVTHAVPELVETVQALTPCAGSSRRGTGPAVRAAPAPSPASRGGPGRPAR